ncbi:hypothetical protein PYW07_014990 [Mythimna separata]|uniref:Uncharacterized protein n=1 Tax=Mythimna separata TaxID=271217 RepID=A0AAD8DYH9_MYTSE|nr:hypothetical protein PYW07_014990 [Mythimna separata]
MAPDKALKATLVSKSKSFCKHCTLHGVYYFYQASSTGVYLLWAMIIAASMALCCFLGHMIWEKFVIDPTLTVVETTHYSMVNIPFPAVTICDTESVYLPKTQNITELLVLRGYNMTEINDFYKSFSEVKRKEYVPEPYVRKMHSLLEDLGYSLKHLLDMFKRPCSDIAVECNWRSRTYNCSEMFRSVLTIVGHCCQFDVPYFMKHADNQTNFISGLDSTEALDVTVKGQSSNGYSVMYVFDYKDKVTLVDSYFSLTPESLFDVNINVWAIDSSTYVKALPITSRKCILETDQGVGAGFHQGCMTRLILRRVVNHCRCLPFDYTYQELDVEEFAICSWDHMICIYQTIEMIEVDIKDIISDSECYQRCDYVEYDTEVEFIKHQRHLRRVSLHSIKQTNLGGIFGLCLGGSVISVIEIVWFLLEILFTILQSWCQGPVIAPKENAKNQVFIISQKDMLSKKSSGKKGVGKYKFVH